MNPAPQRNWQKKKTTKKQTKQNKKAKKPTKIKKQKMEFSYSLVIDPTHSSLQASFLDCLLCPYRVDLSLCWSANTGTSMCWSS